MSYIIHNARWYTEEREYNGSLLIQNGRIQAIKTNFSYYRYMKMNVSPFILTPTHTMVDWHFPITGTKAEKELYTRNHYLQKGCTTVLQLLELKYQFELEPTIGNARKSLMNNCVDFVLGLTCPARLITLEFIRKCKKWKIPIIRVQINSKEEIDQIKWSWVKQALYSYPIVFVPQFTKEIEKNRHESMSLYWQNTLNNDKIPFISTPFFQYQVLSIDNLKKIGIYPKRGNFLVGGEVSYNLYDPKLNTKVEDKPMFHYDNHRLLLTSLREKVVKLYDQTYFDETIGEEITIQTPAFFI
ncbi:hypothetical protein WAK64_09020 [Bacillus spongiae]|uniref:Uncharacterized protein n=1 Tax=Bacillus spongiae TaxID=2683610 RepID=A0ABU8HDE8_9BACI